MSTPPTPRKASRLERTHRIRRLAVTWTVIAFVAVWGGLFVQLRTGHDPSLGSGTATAALTSTTSATSGTSAGSVPSTVSSTASSSAPSAVTTSQS